MGPTKVEIGQYREVNKGSLKAFFSMVIYPQGEKVLDCAYYVSGDQAWWKFPRKEVLINGKKEYIPYVSYLNKNYHEQLRMLTLQALQKLTPQEQSHAKSQSYPNQKNQVHSGAFFDEESPF